ncbi:MAG: Tll0287-like domain-containing protein [Halothiobacillus sp.]
MRLSLSVSALAALLCVSAQAQAEISSASEQPALQQSQLAIKDYASTLKSALESAMQNGGPMAAVSVCHTEAPLIGQEMSKKYGVEIHRTSLKPRQTPPQDWEKPILTQFNAEKAVGKPIDEIVWHRAVDVNGERELRLMKAIPTGEVCLTCHGTAVAPALLQKIKSLYPHDQAVGYKLGDIRGAFSVTAPIKHN